MRHRGLTRKVQSAHDGGVFQLALDWRFQGHRPPGREAPAGELGSHTACKFAGFLKCDDRTNSVNPTIVSITTTRAVIVRALRRCLRGLVVFPRGPEM